MAVVSGGGVKGGGGGGGRVEGMLTFFIVEF